MKIGIDNAAFSATAEIKPRKYSNLGNISEIASQWTIEDVQQHANNNSRKLYRYKLPRNSDLKEITSVRVQSKMNPTNKKLNRSLTQLNLEGAISTGTLKAIERSTSLASCAVLGPMGHRKLRGGDLSRSLNYNRDDMDRKKVLHRTTSTAGIYYNNNNCWDLRRTSSTRGLGRMASTISLV